MLLTSFFNRLKNNERTYRVSYILFAPFFLLAFPLLTHAQAAASQGRGFFIAGIVTGILSLVLFGVTIWAVVQYRQFTADDPRAVRARLILLIAGGAAVFLLISALVFFILGRTRGGSGSGEYGGSPGPVQPPVPSQFPTRVVERHTPRRDEQNVPRNTSILITFREAIDEASILDTKGTTDFADDTVRSEALVLRKKDGGPPIALRGKILQGQRTLHATPTEFLGDSIMAVSYTVQVMGTVQKKKGGSMFPSGTTYTWSFTTGRTLDTTPPTIVSIRPRHLGVSAPNSAVQVVFFEPIDPGSLGLTSGGMSGLALTQNGKQVVGSWILSVDGKTAEFLPEAECGKNSCGKPMYCLPAGAQLTLTATPASVGREPPTARVPYDGIVDLAGNSLDGNGNGKAEGVSDVYRSSFSTVSTIDTVAPVILDVRPASASASVATDAPIEILFSKPMLTSSITQDSLSIEGMDEPLTYRFEEAQGRTRVIIDHPPFAADRLIAQIVSGSIQDLTQNCYQPCTGP